MHTLTYKKQSCIHIHAHMHGQTNNFENTLYRQQSTYQSRVTNDDRNTGETTQPATIGHQLVTTVAT